MDPPPRWLFAYTPAHPEKAHSLSPPFCPRSAPQLTQTRKMQLADFQKAFPGDLQAGALEEIRERCAAMAAAAAEKAVPATGRGGRTAAKRGAEPETVLRTVRARRGPVAPPPKFSDAPPAAPEAETSSRRGTRSRLAGGAAAEPAAAVEQQQQQQPPGVWVSAGQQGGREKQACLPLMLHGSKMATCVPPTSLCCRGCHRAARRSCCCPTRGHRHVWWPAAADAHAICWRGDGAAHHHAHTEARRPHQGGACAGCSHRHHGRWVGWDARCYKHAAGLLEVQWGCCACRNMHLHMHASGLSLHSCPLQLRTQMASSGRWVQRVWRACPTATARRSQTCSPRSSTSSRRRLARRCSSAATASDESGMGRQRCLGCLCFVAPAPLQHADWALLVHIWFLVLLT